ncbi:MAG: hypothetical protein HOV81_43810 [Kofleriaceae bacterium]|nr:hypothetical protein [Kofleriaceae bacterium]
MKFGKGHAVVVGVVALAAIGIATDSGPLILGGGDSHAIVGRPLTPMSYAGVARRTARRSAYAGAYYGGAYGGPAYAAPVPVAPSGYVTALPGGCVPSGGVYVCGSAQYRPYYNGPTVVYRPM